MLKCCGTCKFFEADSQPHLQRVEKTWVWGGKCGWASQPIPSAAVKCGVAACSGAACPTWEKGGKDYLALTPKPVYVPKAVSGDG